MTRRRLPSPWFLVPAIVAGVVGGLVGWSIAHISCRVGEDPTTSTGCPVVEGISAVLGALVAMVGVTVVVVLALRSLAEWREARRGGTGPPGPGCETGS